MKILVAGAAGYIGLNLVQALLSKGHEVTALDLQVSNLDSLRNELSDIIQCDLTEPDQLKGKCAGIEIVISTVGLEFPTKKLSYWDIDYEANLNLLREAESVGVKKMMYISSILADKDTDKKPSLVEAKYAMEKELVNSSLDWVIFRPTSYFKDIINIYIKMAKKGKINIIDKGENRFNPIHPIDMAEVICNNLDTVNKDLNVGGPETFSYLELANMVFDVMDLEAQFSFSSIKGFRRFMKVIKIFKPLTYQLLQFTEWCCTQDMIAEKYGSLKFIDTLKENVSKIKEESK